MTDNMKKTKGTAFYGCLLLLQCLLWGIGNPVTKIGLETVPPFFCTAIRFTLAFVLFMLVFGRQIVSQFKKEYLHSCLVVGLFTAASFIFCTFSLLLTDATIAGFLLSLSVVFTLILALFILKQKASKRFILVILVVVAGMYFLCGNSGNFTFGMGEILALLSALSGSGMLIYSSKHISDIGPIALSTAQAGITAVVSFIFAFFFEDIGSLTQVSGEGWASVVYLAVACTCIAYILQNIALRKVSAAFVSLAFFTEPVFTAIASFFLLGERLSPGGLIGAVLIAVGISFASIMPSEDNALEEEKK